MSLSSWLARVFGRKQAEVSLVAAVADDGSGASADPGDLSPLRADPATGAILVSNVAGASGGATEVTLSALNDKIPDLTTTTQAGDYPSVAVRVTAADPVPVATTNTPLATALPSPTDEGTVVRVVPTGNQPEAGALAVIISTDQPSFGVAAEATLRTRTVGVSSGVFLSAETVSADIHALHTIAVGGATADGQTGTNDRLDTTNATLGSIWTGQTDGTQLARITDGTNNAAVLDAAPAGAEFALVTRNIPGGTQTVAGTVTIDDGGASITVDGTVAISNTVAVDGSGVTQPVSDAGGSLTVDSPQLPAALVGGRLSVDGSGVTQPVSGTVTANVGTTNGLALDATLTGGTQIAISKGPVSPGVAVGAEKPVLVGGSDGTNAQIVNVDSTGAVRLQSGGTPGSAAPSRATQVGGSDGTNLRALKVDTSGRPDVLSNLQVSSAAVTHGNPVPTLAARSTHRTPGSTLSAASTTHTLSSSPGTLRRVEWRYTGAGTKYIVLCDQAGGTATAANWTGWYAAMSNGAGKSYFEFPEGIRCASGIVLGVSATEPQANVAITLSSNAAENFTPTFWSIQP